MGMLGWLGGREAEDMARATSRPLDAAKINGYADRLKASVRDATAFDVAFAELVDDSSLSAQEVIGIAHAFVGGARPKTKKSALASIGQERMRVAHAKSKGDSASKAKMW
jgi:hypothetical protein